jgi:hypothetical protein
VVLPSPWIPREAIKEQLLGTAQYHAEQFRAEGGAKLAAEMGSSTIDYLECVGAKEDGREVA